MTTLNYPRIIRKFLSTPSARRATAVTSIPPHLRTISIHALREEGDACRIRQFCWILLFLSTPSARRATQFFILSLNEVFISIHALREEGDFLETGC